MFTVPDGTDAVTTCPPIAPAGPQPSGFFADCNPAQGFAGTRPIADHFNELILNLRALLTQAKVAAVKGDPTMLWRAILLLPEITTPLTLYVTPAGVPVPANPRGGDPFDSVASAMAYLGQYRVLAQVTITVAAGRYTSTTSLQLQHPDGQFIQLVGAGLSATTLAFTAVSGGVACNLGHIASLSFEGDHGGNLTAGLIVQGAPICTLENVEVRQFSGAGVWITPGSRVNVKTLLAARNNDNQGILVDYAAALTAFGVPSGNTITATGTTTAANVWVINGGTIAIDTLTTDGGGAQAIFIDGPGALVKVRVLTLTNVGTPASAVLVNGGALYAYDLAAPNLWAVSAGATPGSIHAQNGAIVVAGNALTAATRGATSPAVNTLGNTQAYIQAT
jgi:hypothetical protein